MSGPSTEAPPASAAEEFEDLFENAPCGYLTMRPDGRILRANRLIANWTGYAADELVGKRFHDLLTVGTRILYETSFAPELNLRGVCDEMSLDLRTAAGERIAISATGRNHRAADGRSLFTRLVLFKASERRRYERQLVHAHDQKQGLLDVERSTAALREQFIAVLGHDLRNPLAASSSGLALLGEEEMAGQQDMLVEMLQGSVARMAELIDNVLDFARGRLGAGIPLDQRPDVLLTPVLEQVVSELRLGSPGQVITTAFDLADPVRCDPSRMGQLVSNLLANALTHGAADHPVHIHADQAGHRLTIWVANAGEPIPPAAMDRLFQPFFRGEVRASQQGLGLGLHIASEIAKAHGGTLIATSTAHETRFIFQMPMAGQ